jgi:hypothetical protein
MHISLSQFQFQRLRGIFISLNPSVAPPIISTSGNTIRNWIVEDFERKRGQVRKQLALSRSAIHLSFDLWTSPNNLSIGGIIAHYFSSSGRAKDCLLGLKRVSGTHSGENMAQAIVPVLDYYELKDRIGYFVLDVERLMCPSNLTTTSTRSQFENTSSPLLRACDQSCS